MKRYNHKYLVVNKYLVTAVVILSAIVAYAQNDGNRKGVERDGLFTADYSSGIDSVRQKNSIGILDWFKRNHVADNLEAAVTLGTSGLGIELGTPVTKWTRLRVGVDWLPQIPVTMNFKVKTFHDGKPSNNFTHVQEIVEQYTGIAIDDKVKMIGRPLFINAKVLVDVFPFQNNRHWHFTAGFYWGNSQVATANNDKNEKPTLVGLNLYNRAYEYFTNLESIYDVPLGGNTYLDPDYAQKLKDKFTQYGRMGINIGQFKDGSNYIMEPAPDGTVTAKAYVNHFKPYLGFGYSGAMDKAQRWNIGVEAGVWFWGGVPDVINHDYKQDIDIDMTKDLKNVRGRVGTYINIMKCLPVFPVIDLKISYSFF